MDKILRKWRQRRNWEPLLGRGEGCWEKRKLWGDSGDREQRQEGQRQGDLKAGKRGGGAGGGCRFPAAGTASHLKDPPKPTSYAFTVLFQLVPGLERLALVVHKIAPTVLKL